MENKKFMKNLFTLILILTFGISNARTYYVSSSGNDANAGTSPGLAWQTLSKVNSFVFAANDSVLFNRGNLFYGSVVVNRNNMNFGAYGTGAKPIISGFTTLTSWQSSGNGIYSLVVSNIDTLTFNLLSINGVPQIKGRFPNANASNGGYVAYTGGDTTYLKGTPTTNRVGKQIVIRSNNWTVEVCKVTRQNADSTFYVRWPFNLINGSGLGLTVPTPGDGCFWQNDSTFLDVLGEWHLDNNTKRLRVYFGANNPASYSVRAATVDTLFNYNTRTNISINNIDFEGGNLYAIYGTSTNTISITNCKINQVTQAIAAYRVSNISITSDTIKNCLQSAIYANTPVATGVNIIRNYIDSVGLYPGMGTFYQNADYDAILTNGNVQNILENYVDNVGGSCVHPQGSDLNVKYNRLRRFNSVIQDRGGIYIFANGAPGYTNRNFVSNFISEGIGVPEGSNSSIIRSSGIYCDGSSDNILIDSNTFWQIPRSNINLNSPTNVTVLHNTILNDTGSRYANSRTFGYQQVNSDFIRGLVIQNNIGYTFKTTQSQEYYTIGQLSGTLAANVQAIGTINNNYFNFATSTSWDIEYYNPNYNLSQNTLVNWRTLSLFDVNSTILSNKVMDSILLLKNWSPNANNFVLTAQYKDVFNNLYQGTVTLQPYTSLFLIFYSNTTPVVPTPTTTSISPTSGMANGNSFTLTINGTNFQTGISVGQWNGSPRVTTFVSSTQLTMTVTAADNAVANGGTTASITVVNTGNVTPSNAQTYTLTPATPTTTSISPASGVADGNAFVITVNGTNFINGLSTVRWNGSNRTTTFVSSTQLTAIITSGDNAISNGGTTAAVGVINTGNVTSSNSQVYTLNPITPTTASISPTSGVANGSGFTLTVNGTNFISGKSLVYWNGSLRVTTFVNSTQLTAAITNADNAVANGGTTATVTVITTGNVVASNPQTYTLTVATPTTTSISPTSGTSDGAAFTLTVNGTNFIAGLSVVRWSGSARTTTFVSSTQLTAIITTTDNAIANGGTTATITVLNTGNVTASNSQTYTLNPVTPTTTSISPTSGTADGNGFTLTINGTGFINGISTGRWNGSNRTTTFVSSTQITIAVTAADNAIANAGTTATVTVLNTGNATPSNGQIYTLNAATPGTPSISSISPSTGVASGSGFTLTVNGADFANGVSAVQWNGSPRTTTFVNSGQITAAITASDNAVANGGTTANVTVLNSGNPTPSNTQVYTLTPATPTTTSLSPTSGTANGSGFTLTVNGTNFISGISTVRINGNDRATTFVSSTQLTVAITAGDNAISNGGSTASITVLNTGNATVSNSQTYTFVPVTPTTTGINPSSDTADGSSFVMTITGTNFISGISVVNWNGSPRATTFISSTQLTAVITTSDNAVANGNSTASITVTNTGNATPSNAQTYNLIPAIPSIDLITPSSKAVNGNSSSMTVTGTNFINGVSTVLYNGTPRVTTFVNSTTLTVVITALDNAISNANTTAQITVLNTGNSVPSNAVTYTLTPPNYGVILTKKIPVQL
jgi:hypothetical protein